VRHIAVEDLPHCRMTENLGLDVIISISIAACSQMERLLSLVANGREVHQIGVESCGVPSSSFRVALGRFCPQDQSSSARGQANIAGGDLNVSGLALLMQGWLLLHRIPRIVVPLTCFHETGIDSLKELSMLALTPNEIASL
jgi:hypothetical protein